MNLDEWIDEVYILSGHGEILNLFNCQGEIFDRPAPVFR
jgi:hypothetical protein